MLADRCTDSLPEEHACDRFGRNVSAGPSVLCTPRQRCACPACLPCLYALLSHGAFACAACALMSCSVPAYPWRWRRSTASWSSTGLGVVSPRPCTRRFDMVHTAVTTTRKSTARSCCTGGPRSPLGILGEHEG